MIRTFGPPLGVGLFALLLLGAQSYLPTGETETRYVRYVTDGDTINVVVNGHIQSVRLIGIDAPETAHKEKAAECYGVEAKEILEELLEEKTVTLVKDPTQYDRDVYGRLLRYVLLADGTNINEALILGGYAREYTFITPYQAQSAFKNAESIAKSGKFGLWDKCYPSSS